MFEWTCGQRCDFLTQVVLNGHNGCGVYANIDVHPLGSSQVTD